MKLTVKEIVTLVDGTVASGDGERIIEGVAGLMDAGSQDISFLSNMRYRDALYTTGAAAVFIPADLKLEKDISSVLIRVARPDVAFAKILQLVADEKKPCNSGIDVRACVDKSVIIGHNVYIGPCVVVEENTRIEPDCYIGGGSFIGKNCTIGKESFLHPRVTVLNENVIGERAVIHSGCVIGSDGYGFVTQGGRHSKIPQVGNVCIGDNVEIGANVTIDRGTTGSTVIGSGTKIDNLVHIAHNVRIGEDCLIIAQVGISGSATIGKRVTIAGQAGIGGHITIGDNVVVGGKAGVICTIPAGTVVSGFPARPHREVMKIKGYIQKLPELFKEFKKKKKSR